MWGLHLYHNIILRRKIWQYMRLAAFTAHQYILKRLCKTGCFFCHNTQSWSCCHCTSGNVSFCFCAIFSSLCHINIVYFGLEVYRLYCRSVGWELDIHRYSAVPLWIPLTQEFHPSKKGCLLQSLEILTGLLMLKSVFSGSINNVTFHLWWVDNSVQGFLEHSLVKIWASWSIV